jgi:hypothetical protein
LTNLFKASNDANDQTNDNEPESYFAELVGEGKKFQDPEALAKAKYHSDTKYIPRLEQENEELRQELQKRLTAEDLVKQLRSANNDRDLEETDTNSNQLPDTNNIKADVLNEVKKLLEQQQTKTQAQRNVERVSNELKNTWGNNFSSKLAMRAKELDLDQDYLAQLAEQKPDTFLKLILPKTSIGSDYSPPLNSRTAPSSQSGERNKAYYDKIRKENPKLYYSKDIQAQEHRDAIKLGSKFFS